MEKQDFYAKHIGEVYGRLTIVDVVRNPRPQFISDCECGGSVTCDVFSVLHKKTQSCGCLKREILIESGKKNLRPLQIGLVFKNKKGLEFKIVEYVKSTKVKIEFVGSGYTTWAATKEIKNGSVRDWIAYPLLDGKYKPKTTKKRGPGVAVGEMIENFYGCKYEVIEVYARTCKIKFLDSFGYEKVVLKNDARRGIRNPYRKSVAGVGYIGEGKYSSVNAQQLFMIWSNMLVRCYDEESLKKNITYTECSVDERWHCFQDFAAWCEAQPEFIKNKDWHLDKDIKYRGNKIYSPETCSFVPRDINNLFTLRGNKRGDCPLGVHWDNKKETYVAQVNKDQKRKFLGYFPDTDSAFAAYKQAKEEVIREMAEKYKDGICSNVYDSLINWKVEVTD